MNDYEFVLKFALPDPEGDAEEFLARLEEAGCDDALVGIGKRGRIALEFVRSEESAERAVITAISAVLHAIPGVHFIEAGPDLISLREVAELAGTSRQNFYKMSANKHLFPTAAVIENGTELYHYSDVFAWLRLNGYVQGSQKDLDIREETAITIRMVNVALEVHNLPKKITPEIERVVEAA